MKISRRAFGFSAAALAIVAAAPASAQSNLSAEDQATLRQAQAYLTGLTAAQGNFIETGPGGQQRTGKFWLQRPGKMRFEYADPAKARMTEPSLGLDASRAVMAKAPDAMRVTRSTRTP